MENMSKRIKIEDYEFEFEFKETMERLKYIVRLKDEYLGCISISPSINIFFEREDEPYEIIRENLTSILKELMDFERIIIYSINDDNNLVGFELKNDYDIEDVVHLVVNIYIKRYTVRKKISEYIVLSYDIITDIIVNNVLNRGENLEIVCEYLKKEFGGEFVEKLKTLNLENMV